MTDKNKSKHDLEAGWIRELADILIDTGLTDIEIEKNDIRLRVSRQGNAVAVNNVAPVVAAAAPPPQNVDTAPQAPSTHPGTVKSPMVGTVYLAPSPEAKNFVKIGDQVNEGQTIMIVEAMKTMNPITAPKSGKVTTVIVSNAQPVEFDEALFVIE